MDEELDLWKMLGKPTNEEDLTIANINAILEMEETMRADAFGAIPTHASSCPADVMRHALNHYFDLYQDEPQFIESLSGDNYHLLTRHREIASEMGSTEILSACYKIDNSDSEDPPCLVQFTSPISYVYVQMAGNHELRAIQAALSRTLLERDEYLVLPHEWEPVAEISPFDQWRMVKPPNPSDFVTLNYRESLPKRF